MDWMNLIVGSWSVARQVLVAMKKRGMADKVVPVLSGREMAIWQSPCVVTTSHTA